MTGMMLALGMAMGTTAAAEGPRQFQIDVSLYAGDPLGSRDAGTLKVLAEPRMVVVGGRGASFHSGGRIAVEDDRGNTRYEAVGTQIEVLPVRTRDGAIWVEVTTSTREVDPGLGITAGGKVVPGFREHSERRALLVTAGKPVRLRVSAAAPDAQTWVELTVHVVRPMPTPMD